MNLQDSFLNQVRKDNTDIKIVLMDGSELVGIVKGFDSFTIILSEKQTQHLVYKHAIAQIISSRPTGRREEGSPGEPHPKGQSVKDGPAQHERPAAKGDAFNTLNLSRVVVSDQA